MPESIGEEGIFFDKPNGTKYSLAYDAWKAVKQGLVIAGPGLISVLVFLESCSALDDIVVPVGAGVSAASIVTFVYRVYKNVLVREIPT